MLNSRKRIELVVLLILMTGCFETLYGLIQTYSGSNHIWWYKKTAYLKDVTGTYINRNHFAGLMVMGLLLGAAYVAGLAQRPTRKRGIPGLKSSIRGRLSRVLSGEQRFNKRASILFAAVVIGIGLVFSASRGGLISAAGGMMCMGLLFLLRRGHRRNGLMILILFLIIAGYSLHIGAEYTVGRFDHFEVSYKERARWTQKTLDMFRDYRLTGVGVGSFQYAYPKYQAPEDLIWFIRHAHNDWAQFLAEAGIAGLFLLFAGISYYLYRTVRLWMRRGDPFAVCVGAAPLTVMIALGIHSYSDFNLHIPANFLMLLAIMAVGYGALHLQRRYGREKALLRYHILPLKYKGCALLLLVVGLIAWNGFWTVRHFVAEFYCNTVVQSSTSNGNRNPPLEEIEKAIQWDGNNGGYRWKLAWELTRIRNAEMGNLETIGEDRHRLQMRIARTFETAVRVNPFTPGSHAQLGWEYMGLGRDLAYRQKWLPAADRSMDRAAYFAGDYYGSLHESLGNYWLMRSKASYGNAPEWDNAWAKAKWHYRKAMSLNKGGKHRKMVERIAKHVWTFYPDEVFLRKAFE